MEIASQTNRWLRRLVLIVGLTLAVVGVSSFLLSRADGPVFIFAGGPLRSGAPANLTELDWDSLDTLHELELEIVAAASSLTLWFSVHDGIPYVACDLDCIGGNLDRWPQQIERDPRVVLRIDNRRIDGRLIHVPHETEEYLAVRAGRNLKYSGDGGGRAASETAAHSTVVDVGEVLTGRSTRAEPGDRLYRVESRQ